MDSTSADRILAGADEQRPIEVLRQLAVMHRTLATVDALGGAEMTRQFRDMPAEYPDNEIPFGAHPIVERP